MCKKRREGSGLEREGLSQSRGLGEGGRGEPGYRARGSKEEGADDEAMGVERGTEAGMKGEVCVGGWRGIESRGS